MVSAERRAFVKHASYTRSYRDSFIPTFRSVCRRGKNLTSVPNRKQFRLLPIAVATNRASNIQSTQISQIKHTTNPLFRFSRLAFKEWRLLLPALASALISGVVITAEPVIYGQMLGCLARLASLSPSVTIRRYVTCVVAIAIVYMIETIGSFFFVAFMSKVGDNTTRRLRKQLFQSSVDNDVGFFDQSGRAQVQQALTAEVRVVRERFWNNLGQDRGLRAILEVLFGIVMFLVLTSRKGTFFFGLLVPSVAVIVGRLGTRDGKLAARVTEKEMTITEFVNEKVRGVRTLKIFGAEDNEIGALGRLMDVTEAAANTYGFSKAMTEASYRLGMYITIIVLFLSAGQLVISGVMPFEQLSAMTGFLWLFVLAIQGIVHTVTDVSTVQESLRRIYAVIDGAESYQSLAESSLLPPSQLPSVFNGQVNFNNVHFHYPSRPNVPVLKGITFTIKPGQTVALTGSSGGGKSTIAAMLSRFYVPTQGSVTLDGVDIQSLSRELFADHISLVDQEPVLFQGTIRENIAYGANSDKLSDDAIVQAAKEANAHDFIMQLPQQYDTVWGPGSNLSGGQKQRVAIARSLAKSPQVLLLDEATSALDQESERAVQNALDRIMEHRTVLIIAHRLSTIRSADMILFVQNGEITERGTYDELVARPNGSFRALVEAAANSANRGSEMEMI